MDKLIHVDIYSETEKAFPPFSLYIQNLISPETPKTQTHTVTHTKLAAEIVQLT